MLRHKRNVPDKWYQHLLDIRDGLVEPDYLGRYIVGSGEKHRRLKEMEAKQTENQSSVVNLVSPVAQATEMARSEIKRELKKEKRPKKAEICYICGYYCFSINQNREYRN